MAEAFEVGFVGQGLIPGVGKLPTRPPAFTWSTRAMAARMSPCKSSVSMRWPTGKSRSRGARCLPRSSIHADARTRERVLFPQRLASYLAGRELTRDLVAEYLAVEHLRFTPRESEVQAAFDFATVALREPDVLTPEFAMALMLRSIEQLVPALGELEWTIEHERKGRLITSGTPLVTWRPPSPRDAFEGIGIGNAHEIRFPLDPAKQLILSRRRRPASVRITTDRVFSCNLDMIAGCHRMIIGRPRFQRQLLQPQMMSHRPVLRFNTGPLYERQPDGTTVHKGEVLHTWVPRR